LSIVYVVLITFLMPSVLECHARVKPAVVDTPLALAAARPRGGMMPRVSESVPDWWDDELDALVTHCVAVFGEDATDDTVIRVTEHFCQDMGVDDVPMREALVPAIVETLKAEFRRRLTPH
jgi:hypothetical protein